ncbi:ACBD3 [Lepeophtheirus salmonis]|uniref:ACBD3 n=1 Tax=Lepeophtheirus salmonis TaxID=72036 RepID=A0A7R8D0S0_LEPSM|nr:ACBD3 [Lepeophtheirus salmonis]CAF2943873.1 ACBD3 [Lepeophtheirus salmonis]
MENSSQTTTTIAEQINVTPNKLCDMVSNLNITPADGKGEEVGVQVESEVYFQEEGAIDDRDDSDNFDEDEEDDEDHVCSDECGFCSCEEFLPANIGGDSIIKVGQGETATVRVPTRDDGGSALFWEFATDSYDIAFGLFFEWSKSEDEQHVTVHVSDSEDEDLNDDESFNECDPERASAAALLDKRPQMSIIVPIYRRDCHEEVYAGSHTYPGQGVYLLNRDLHSNWRTISTGSLSKTVITTGLPFFHLRPGCQIYSSDVDYQWLDEKQHCLATNGQEHFLLRLDYNPCIISTIQLRGVVTQQPATPLGQLKSSYSLNLQVKKFPNQLLFH